MYAVRPFYFMFVYIAQAERTHQPHFARCHSIDILSSPHSSGSVATPPIEMEHTFDVRESVCVCVLRVENFRSLSPTRRRSAIDGKMFIGNVKSNEMVAERVLMVVVVRWQQRTEENCAV